MSSYQIKQNSQQIIDIIIPVYLDYNCTQKCIKSVLSSRQNYKYQLIVIDDCSPEPSLSFFLEDLAVDERIKLIKNERNMGFVTSANIGMEAHPDRDVVLLNNDTEVANNWLDRLCRCAQSESSIGTITPFSNNATICSYPFLCCDNDMPAGLSTNKMDSLFRQANYGKYVEIPTAVGFCMYIKRCCLNEIGYFDDRAFPTGYGEENDFCQRATYKGWRHMLCADTFVYHQGSKSFGKRKLELQAVGHQKLIEMHPNYDNLIADFIARDPLQTLRFAVDIQRAGLSNTQALEVVNELGKKLKLCAEEKMIFYSMERRLRDSIIKYEDALHHAESLLKEKEAEVEAYNKALHEAQHYVRERESEISTLNYQINNLSKNSAHKRLNLKKMLCNTFKSCVDHLK